MRAQKRSDTQDRIRLAAVGLFAERGYDAVTVDQIAAAACVSKRTYFDYFSSKDDVVRAWQDGFSAVLAEAVAARPTGESIGWTIEHAIEDAVVGSLSSGLSNLTDGVIEIASGLRARNQFKYIELEVCVVHALEERYPAMPPLKLALFGMLAVGVLRLGLDEWNARGLVETGNIASFNAEMHDLLWTVVRDAKG